VEPLLATQLSTRLYKPAGVWHKDHYYLSICTSGDYNNITLDYDATLDSWWVHTSGFDHFAVTEDERLLGVTSTNSTSGHLVECFDPTRNTDTIGGNFTAYWKGRYEDVGTPFLRKRLRQVHSDGYGSWDLYVHRDFVEDGTPEDTVIFGLGPDPQEHEWYSLGVARAFSLEYRHAGNHDARIFAGTMNFTPRKD
jgi:hypothetical protein